mmetsp:Transcript_34225/g.59888  ORF Transcript_34225/g.59888 Transcript_34225/m.59888 type:complete len:353 (-) Transcript_34225:202-1260(-)
MIRFQRSPLKIMSLELQRMVLRLAQAAVESDKARNYEVARDNYQGALGLFDSIILSLKQPQKDLYILKKLEYSERLQEIEAQLKAKHDAEKTALEKLRSLILRTSTPQGRLNDHLFGSLLRTEISNHGDEGILLYGPKNNNKGTLVKGLASLKQYKLVKVDIRLLVEDFKHEAQHFLQNLSTLLDNKPLILHFKGLTAIAKEPELCETLCLVVAALQPLGHIITTSIQTPQLLPESLLQLFPKKLYVPLPDANLIIHLVEDELTGLELELTDEELNDTCDMLIGYTYGEIKMLFYRAFVGKLSSSQESQGLSDEDLALVQFEQLLSSIEGSRPSTTYQDLSDFEAFAIAHCN